ncbi:hypothetical protein [Comamonas testosteroni]|uniref:hypothetical protein n=1 Tax=Comamonas testosteroni TaxID=285 RepID=UPI0006B8EB94|nr:hypothetical protein [Comamonas testosteroni]
MKTSFDFQYLPKGADRPIDDGEIVAVEAGKADGAIIAPAVGDFIQLVGAKEPHRQFDGIVKSRLFRYVIVGEEVYCHINIVVEEADVNWGLLIKE